MVVKTVAALRQVIQDKKSQALSIGFIPTMGYLHDGHMSLVRAARQQTDVSVVSIFVNPTQFGPHEDYEDYPRDQVRDIALCEQEGVDIIFIPSVDEMYPSGDSSVITVRGSITETLCGASRPGHFEGVTTVVGKLFHMVQPDFAFFGQKDAQQVAVLKKMVRELRFPLEIIACPIRRESDGLAMSSRNIYLTDEQRLEAVVLSQSLHFVEKQIALGILTNTQEIVNVLTENIQKTSGEIDYVRVVDPDSLEDLTVVKERYLIAVAVRFGQTRLIDNISKASSRLSV